MKLEAFEVGLRKFSSLGIEKRGEMGSTSSKVESNDVVAMYLTCELIMYKRAGSFLKCVI